MIAELEKRADEMATKSLAALPAKIQATKLPVVRVAILKRLTEQAQAGQLQLQKPAASQAAPPAEPPPAAASPPVPSQGMDEDDEETERRVGLRRPATELPPPQDGVEACGDDPWFADPQIRLALKDAVEVAHSQLKILVRDAGEEISRILPQDGRELKAGAVMRLGGSHLGGYGEVDVAYAYRQLSRALHPDKNPNNPDAENAFKRLKEAQGQLLKGLEETRELLARLQRPLRKAVEDGELKRPQEALFAEATRLLAALLGLATEGQVPLPAKQRNSLCLKTSNSAGGGGWARPALGTPEGFLEQWFKADELLQAYSHEAVRSAYDCAPKRYRAHFLCLLSRLAQLEGLRGDGCIRQLWSQIWEVFPELQLWQSLQSLLKRKCEVHGRKPQRDRSRSPRRGPADEANYSQWARRWRKMIRAILPGGEVGAASWADPEVRKLCAALWRDFADPLEKGAGAEAEGARRCLALFRTESRGAADVATQKGAAPAEWAFVPAADLLLIVGEGLIGVSLEGVFSMGRSNKRLPFATAIFQTMMG